MKITKESKALTAFLKTCRDQGLNPEKLRQAMIDATNPWMPIESVPMDGNPVLVLLAEEHHHSRIHSATYLPNIACIGGNFSFDVPEATHWKKCE